MTQKAFFATQKKKEKLVYDTKRKITSKSTFNRHTFTLTRCSLYSQFHFSGRVECWVDEKWWKFSANYSNTKFLNTKSQSITSLTLNHFTTSINSNSPSINTIFTHNTNESARKKSSTTTNFQHHHIANGYHITTTN